MSGKSRKSPTSRRSTAAGPQSQSNSPAAAGLLGQSTPSSRRTTSRISILYWIGGVIVLILVLYLGVLFLAPTFLPNWMNPGPVGGPISSLSPTIGTPQPSGTGNRISFIRTSQNSTKRDLYVVNADGSDQQQVTHDLYVEGSASWSPDGTRLIVQASVSGISTVVFVTVGPDNKSANAGQLTADVKADSVLPVWSPDGNRVAFQSKRDGGDYQVFVMDADGSNKKRLSDGKGYAGQPAWSPDGKSIAYIAGADGNAGTVRELYVVPLDNGAPKQVTSLNTSLAHPIWSPGGDIISFLQTVDQYDERILTIKPDGTGERTLLQGGLNSTQSFSPDGLYLTYYKVAPGSGENVYKAAVANGKETGITQGGSGNYLSTWSPDGKQLAWASKTSDTGSYRIVVANADGSNVHAISQGEGDDYQPSWGFIK